MSPADWEIAADTAASTLVNSAAGVIAGPSPRLYVEGICEDNRRRYWKL